MIKLKLNTSSILALLPYFLLFLFLLVYFYFSADYILFYQEKSFIFVLSSDFLNSHLNQPGSLLIYAGKFLSSFYFIPLLGSIVIAAVLCLLVFFNYLILRILNGRNVTIIPFLTGGILFYLHSNYQYLIYNSLGLLLQLVLFYLTIRYMIKYKEWLIIIITPLWYFITGSFAAIFFVMFLIYLFFTKEKFKWIKLVALISLNILFIFLSREYLFFQPVEILLVYPYSAINTGDHSRLFFSVVAILSLLPVLSVIKFWNFRINKLSVLIIDSILPIVLISIPFIILIKRNDENNKHYFHVEKLFYQNKLDDLIAFNTANPSNNMLTSYLTNIALCETGKLNDLLFNIPQSIENNTLSLQWKRISEVLKRGGYFYYTIGMINECHRWCYEYMVMEGLTPEGLKMLIKTELINGNYAMAAKYVSILKKSFFYRKEAKAFEKLLFDDAAVNNHSELGEKRKSKLKSDFFVATQDPLLNLENILASDSSNRKVFEYILAYLLLKKDFLSIVKEIPKLEIYDYKKIPVHIEEVVVVYEALTSGEYTLPGNLKISENTKLRFKQYYETFQKLGNDRKAAQPYLKKQFGDTFWYYVFYN